VQILLLVRAISQHNWNTVHLGILLCALTVFSLIPGTRRWPWSFLVPVLLYLALLQSFRPLRLTATWLRTGHPTLPIWIVAATVAVISALSLLVWFQAGVSRRQMASGFDSLMVSWKTHPSGPRIRAVQRSGRRDDLAWCHLRLPRAGETSDYLSGADAGCVIWGCSPARISQRKRRYIACSSLRSDTRFTTGADGRTPRSLCYSCRYRFLNLWYISLSCA
jgi:hypothetical protein